VGVTFADRAQLGDRDVAILQHLRAVGRGPRVGILVAADADIAAGPWDFILRRPQRMERIVEAVARLARLLPPRTEPSCSGLALRLGPPWPSAHCRGCGASRHCAPPRNRGERERARVALVQFALEHDAHAKAWGPPASA
jgi:hypothetical protein